MTKRFDADVELGQDAPGRAVAQTQSDLGGGSFGGSASSETALLKGRNDDGSPEFLLSKILKASSDPGERAVKVAEKFHASVEDFISGYRMHDVQRASAEAKFTVISTFSGVGDLRWDIDSPAEPSLRPRSLCPKPLEPISRIFRAAASKLAISEAYLAVRRR